MTLTSAARKLKQVGVKKSVIERVIDGSATLRETSKEYSVPSSTLPSPSSSISSGTSLESSDDGGPIGRETRRRLVEWWNKEYCASRMRLCIIGKGAVLCPSRIAPALTQI